MINPTHINQNSSDSEPILVSICCLAYNHEKYLEEALDSFLNQKTTFSIEIIIHDDASTDNTTEIIKAYTEKYPKIFKPLIQTTNQRSIYKSGMNPRFNFPRATGKYIALCEGDDYWTDPLKLQKQADFLEHNPDFNICFTRAYLLRNNQQELHKVPVSDKDIFSFDDLLYHGNFIATASVMFKNNINGIPEWFNKLPYGDMAVYLLIGKDIKIKCLDDITSVYRIHDKGAWHQNTQVQKIKARLKFNQTIYAQVNENQKTILFKKQKELIQKLGSIRFQRNRIFKSIFKVYFKKKYSLIK